MITDLHSAHLLIRKFLLDDLHSISTVFLVPCVWSPQLPQVYKIEHLVIQSAFANRRMGLIKILKIVLNLSKKSVHEISSIVTISGIIAKHLGTIGT